MLHREEGASPVIAEILMIAVTVILVSAVYMMVTNGIISTPYGANQLNGALIVDYSKSNSTSVYFNIVLNHPQSTPVSNVRIIIFPANGGAITLSYKGNYIWNNASQNSNWYYEAKLIDNDGDGKFSNGDALRVSIISNSHTNHSFHDGDRVAFAIDTYEGGSTGGKINF